MIETGSYACAICGEANSEPTQWFLVTENYWEDKLKVLEWSYPLARQHGIHLACSAAHVQELVVHWMATGSVNHPFAKAHSWKSNTQSYAALPRFGPVSGTHGVRTLGELTVHRESLRRVLSENPESLKSILDVLHGALQPDDAPAPSQPEIWLGRTAQER